eukprot:TRINITY_DN4257_c0_g1_i1.p1 TRINITY_DN4257_c0_g1~~TRINITY_DN4257_c0_g1_i1.p1  ORF type:complete len:1077 (+),score=297.77 TRINITY_DN4257_c0_g1_i1:86-3316(+)
MCIRDRDSLMNGLMSEDARCAAGGLLPRLVDQATYTADLGLLTHLLSTAIPQDLPQDREGNRLQQQCTTELSRVLQATEAELTHRLSSQRSLEEIAQQESGNVAWLANTQLKRAAEELTNTVQEICNQEGLRDLCWQERLNQIANDNLQTAEVQTEAAAQAKAVEQLLGSVQASVKELLQRTDNQLQRALNPGRASEQVLNKAVLVLTIARAEQQMLVTKAEQSAQAALKEAMNSGDIAAVTAAQRGLEAPPAESKLPGSSVDLVKFEGSVVEVREILAKQQTTERVALYPAQLSNLQQIEAQLATALLSLPEDGQKTYEKLAQSAQSFSSGTLPVLKILLQKEAEEVHCAAIRSALRAQDSVLVQQTLDRVSIFYQQRCGMVAAGSLRAPLGCDWIMPLAVSQHQQAAESFLGSSSSDKKEEMSAEEAERYAQRCTALINKAVQARSNHSLLEASLEQLLRPEKAWPGGQPPLSLISKLHQHLGTTALVGSSQGRELEAQMKPMLSSALMLQRIYRGFKVRGILEHRHNLSDREARIVYGSGRGTPSCFLQEADLALRHSQASMGMNEVMARNRQLARDKKTGHILHECTHDWFHSGGRTPTSPALTAHTECDSKEDALRQECDALKDAHQDYVSAQEQKALQETQNQQDTALQISQLEARNLALEKKLAAFTGETAAQQVAQSSFEKEIEHLQGAHQKQLELLEQHLGAEKDRLQASHSAAQLQLHTQKMVTKRQREQIDKLKKELQQAITEHQAEVALSGIRQEQALQAKQAQGSGLRGTLEKELKLLNIQLKQSKEHGEQAMRQAITKHEAHVVALLARLESQESQDERVLTEQKKAVSQQTSHNIRQLEQHQADVAHIGDGLFEEDTLVLNPEPAPTPQLPNGLNLAGEALEAARAAVELTLHSNGSFEMEDQAFGCDSDPEDRAYEIVLANASVLQVARDLRRTHQEEQAIGLEMKLAAPDGLLSALQATFVGIIQAKQDWVRLSAMLARLAPQATLHGLDHFFDIESTILTLEELELPDGCRFEFSDFCEAFWLCRRLLFSQASNALNPAAGSELRWFHFRHSYAPTPR